MHQAFPDLQVTIEQVVAAGNEVMVRSVLRGTQHGELWGIPPTGRHLVVQRLDCLRFADGKIVEHWASDDQPDILRQLGQLPLTPPARPAIGRGCRTSTRAPKSMSRHPLW